jgi:hypothetical protein
MAGGRSKWLWQDDTKEGFSMWDDNVPTAQTLSRNRLRRRRAQFAFDLTHLNYKEAPFEAFTHLHNIRGMCNRIQSQVCMNMQKLLYFHMLLFVNQTS